MPIVILLCILPLLLAACLQYLACRFLKKTVFRWLPPLFCLTVTAIVAAARFSGWSSDGGMGAPIETLLLIPGLPAAVVIAGLFVGWRIWKWRWSPRIINEKGRKP